MATYLVTGAAGFIASRVISMLLEAGHTVVGVDNLNDAYDVRMKEYRLNKLVLLPNFSFHRLDITDRATFAGNSPLRAGSLRGGDQPGSTGRCAPIR